MIRLANFGGFLISLYIWFNYTEWTLIANSNIIISRMIVNIIHLFPNYMINFFLLMLIIIFLNNTVFNNRGLLLYLITLLLFYITLKINLSYLMLEPTTTFFLFKISHQIPLEYYQQHLNNCLNHIVNINPKIIEDSSLQQFQEFILDKLDYNHLITLNAQQIEMYAWDLCKSYNEELHLINKQIFSGISAILILAFIPTIIRIYRFIFNF